MNKTVLRRLRPPVPGTRRAVRQRERLEMRLKGSSRLTWRGMGKAVGDFLVLAPSALIEGIAVRFGRLATGLYALQIAVLSVPFMRYLRLRDGVCKPKELAGLDE